MYALTVTIQSLFLLFISILITTHKVIVVTCIYYPVTSTLGATTNKLTNNNNRIGNTSTISSSGKVRPTTTSTTTSSTKTPIRVAFQGVPGAYSEKSLRELLGPNVIAVGYPTFEACYRSVASMECDYACLPIENSLGGSIHENYDLMLRYDLTIVAEHEFRVRHCLLTRDNVDMKDIKYALSHPQALAQCDNYLRGRGITPIPAYDTAGAAKMISEGKGLPDGCTIENSAAIASDLAGKVFQLSCQAEGIEDDDSNFTRFLLLSRQGVAQYINKSIPSKTSIVFTLPNTPGGLYKALSCFSLRDIDCSKIESRPTSAQLLAYLRFRSTQQHEDFNKASNSKDSSSSNIPRFRYCFYLDFLTSELDEAAQNALHHLQEQATYCRVLGSYPAKSRVVGPVATAVEESKAMTPEELGTTPLSNFVQTANINQDTTDKVLNIGIVGFNAFGQSFAKILKKYGHSISCFDLSSDKSSEADQIQVDYYPKHEIHNFLKNLDVVVLCMPLIDFEHALESLPMDKLQGKLIVETCILSSFPISLLLDKTKPSTDILSANCLFGWNSHTFTNDWEDLPITYEKVRIQDAKRLHHFLSILEKERCKLVEMAAEQSDSIVGDAEFVTHLTGRLLDKCSLTPLPVMSKDYAALLDVIDMTKHDSFDVFYGLFQYNENSKDYLKLMRDNLSSIERQLAAKEAYLIAKKEMEKGERDRLINECKILLREVIQGEDFGSSSSSKNGMKNDDDAVSNTVSMSSVSGKKSTTSDIQKKVLHKISSSSKRNDDNKK